MRGFLRVKSLSMVTLGQLGVKTKVLSADDSLTKAAEAVAGGAVPSVPVIEDGYFAGMVTARLLAERATDELATPWPQTRVGDLNLVRGVALPAGTPAREALEFLRNAGLDEAVVMERDGGISGIVSLAALVNALHGRVKPALIGGMATPFGVYLTGGGARGGVGDLALMSAGVFIAGLHAVAALLTEWLMTLPGRVPGTEALARWLTSVTPEQGEFVFVMVTMALFVALFRFSWVTGFHAAEHQVVHTLEAGDDLRADVVARQPRVHPRCGTNLVAGMFLLLTLLSVEKPPFDVPLLQPLLRGIAELNPLAALLLTAFFWRRLGSWLQQNVTTKPANAKQLESGITATEQLLERYAARAGERLALPRRLWNMGMAQVFAGYLVVAGGVHLLNHFVPLPEGLLKLW